VWKFLLGYFPWESTRQERNDLRKDMTETYFTMKLQWKSISTDQEHRFSDFRERKSLIGTIIFIIIIYNKKLNILSFFFKLIVSGSLLLSTLI
jgi:hypothetical protein